MRRILFIISGFLICVALSSCSQVLFALGTDSGGHPFIVTEDCVAHLTRGIEIKDTKSRAVLWEARPIPSPRKMRFFRFADSLPGWQISGTLPSPGSDAYVVTGFGQQHWVSSNSPNMFSEYRETFASYTAQNATCAAMLSNVPIASTPKSP